MNLHNNYLQQQQQQQLPADPTGGLSNFSLLLISLNGLTIVVIVLIFICHRIPHDDYDDNNDQHNSLHAADNVAYEQALQDADVSLLNRAQRRARAKLLMKKSRRLDASAENPAHNNVAAVANHNNNNNHHDLNDDNIHHPPRVQAGPDTANRPGGAPTLSRKQRQKMAKEMERKERQANLEQIQLIQKQREIQEKAVRQKVQLAKLQKIKQDKQIQLEKEYLHQNYMFPDTDLDTRVTVEEFLEDLNMNPVVSLEETAEEFHVSEEDLVYRLQELERDGRIPHGIWNRSMGEYIYISENVMKQVADYIMKKGAVSLADIKGELLRYILAGSGNDDVSDDRDVHDDGIKHDAPLSLEQKKVQ